MADDELDADDIDLEALSAKMTPILKEGFLEKKNQKNRYFVVSQEERVIGYSKEQGGAFLKTIEFDHILKARVNDDDQKMIDIALDAASDHDAGRTFHLRAKDEKEARDWVQCIKKISRHEKERRAKLGNISSGGKVSASKGNVVGKAGKEADAAFAEAKVRNSSSSSVFGKASSTKDAGCLSSCVIS